MNAFLFALRVVEQGEKSGERVRNGRGTEMVLEDLEHLKTLPVKSGAGILEEEAYGPILKGSLKLPFPILAGKGIPCIHQQQLIRVGRRETRGAKPEKDKVPGLEVVVSGLDRRKSEAVSWNRDRRGSIGGRRHLKWCGCIARRGRRRRNRSLRDKDREIIRRGGTHRGGR